MTKFLWGMFHIYVGVAVGSYPGSEANFPWHFNIGMAGVTLVAYIVSRSYDMQAAAKRNEEETDQ